MKEHTHAIIMYSDSNAGAYCLFCDLVLDRDEVQNILSDSINAAQHSVQRTADGLDAERADKEFFDGLKAEFGE